MVRSSFYSLRGIDFKGNHQRPETGRIVGIEEGEVRKKVRKPPAIVHRGVKKKTFTRGMNYMSE